MFNLFLTVLEMSLIGSFVIGIICLTRIPFKKLPKNISYCLWAVAGFRMVFPFSFENVINRFHFQPQDYMTQVVEPYFPEISTSSVVSIMPILSITIDSSVIGMYANRQEIASAALPWTLTSAYIWLAGALVMAVYGVYSYIVLKNRMGGAVHVEGNVYEADIESPFVLGLLAPKIYLPLTLADGHVKVQ